MKTLESIRGGLRVFRAISPQIRASQIDMLLTIALRPGISQSELACECDLTVSAVSRMVDVMSTTGRRDGKGQSLGFVAAERAANDDRTIVLRLTPKGKDVIGLYQEASS
jgi:DNA-binding MarR family transcriptional regulator